MLTGIEDDTRLQLPLWAHSITTQIPSSRHGSAFMITFTPKFINKQTNGRLLVAIKRSCVNPTLLDYSLHLFLVLSPVFLIELGGQVISRAVRVGFV